ncbi:MAG: sugar ABC transporter substrate-binding protein [Synergistaceae bacterium]|nr:sugar ABC transporter substrate-binding protein [Synergistaceae bacterium]
MKKFLAVVLALVMAAGFCTFSANGAARPAAAADDITIGVSIWSSTDTLGSQVKRLLDVAAAALGVRIMYVDQAHISEQVTASVETLIAAGADGIIICNSSSAEMRSVINNANQNKVYVAQFFRVINERDNPNEYALANSSPYYAGAVHEDEVANGANLARILCEKGNRKIALQGWEAGDATFLGRWEGYRKGVEEWNAANPNDQAVLLEPQYGGTTSDTGRATAEAIIAANPDIDALIVAGGGGDPLVGAIAAIDGLGLTGKIAVASTDFLPDLAEQLARGAIAVESGGHYADPLFAFMMVYNAIKGNYEVPTDSFYRILFPYIYVASVEDYAGYDKYFVESLPYTSEELVKMSGYSFEELSAAAAALSIEDVAGRRGN